MVFKYLIKYNKNTLKEVSHRKLYIFRKINVHNFLHVQYICVYNTTIHVIIDIS